MISIFSKCTLYMGLGALLLFSCQTTTVQEEEYQLVWADEFDYSGAIDSLKWGYETGMIRNNEEQYYTDERKNSRVEQGMLILEVHKEKIANANYDPSKKRWKFKMDTAQYTSASLTTIDKAQWKYAKIDIRAKLSEGVGLWPAFWMLSESWKSVGWPACGEIDIMEHVGYEPDSIFGTIHSEAYNHILGTQKGRKTYIEKPYEQFHIHTLEWTPDHILFYLDGKEYNRVENEHLTTAEWPFDQNFHLKLNIAVGGGLGGQKGIDDSALPSQMVVDYVRVYQKRKFKEIP